MSAGRLPFDLLNGIHEFLRLEYVPPGKGSEAVCEGYGGKELRRNQGRPELANLGYRKIQKKMVFPQRVIYPRLEDLVLRQVLNLIYFMRTILYFLRRRTRQGVREGTMPAKSITENVGGVLYEYVPMGKYVVKAKGVCGGRPTFKYTRIGIAGILARLEAGEDIDTIVEDYHGRISREAILEATNIRKSPRKVPKRTAA